MFMNDRLKELLTYARERRMTPEERREQSISFVLGNANVEGDTLARGTVAISVPPAPKGKKK
jgi:hypothetical protein